MKANRGVKTPRRSIRAATRARTSQTRRALTRAESVEHKPTETRLTYHSRMLDYVSDAVVSGDLQFRILSFNRAAETLYGWTEAEALGREFQELMRPDYGEHTRDQVVAEFFAQGEWFGEATHQCKDGRRIPVEIRLSLVKDAAGNPVKVVSVIRDITERKRAEEALRLSEERFSQAFKASPAGMTITRIADGKFIDANESFCRIFEFNRDEVIGHTSTELNMWTPEERKKLIDEQIRSGGLHNFELQARAKSGRVVNILFSSKPIEIGGETHHITTMIDITERKRAETELRQRADELSTLNVLGRQISASLSPERVIMTALEEILRTVRPNLAYFFLREGERLILNRVAPESARARLGDIPEHRVGECMCGLAIAQGKAIYSRDIYTDLRCTWDECKKAGFRSFAALPLHHGDEFIGVIGLASNDERDFERQYEFLETLADQIAIGLQNAFLFEQTQQRAHYLALLNDITRAALEQTEMNALLQTLADRLGELINADGCYITLWDEQQHKTIPAVASGKFRETFPTLLPLPGEPTMTESVLRAGHALVAEDVFNTPYVSARIAAQFSARSLLGLPLIAGKQKLGAALIEFNQPHRFTLDEIARGEQAAGQIALAIAQAHLLDSERAARAQLQDLSRQLIDVQETERRALASELHDEIGQALTAIKLNLQAIQLVPDPTIVASRLDDSIKIVERALRQTRDLSLDLRPSLLDDFGLVPALDWYLKREAERSGLAIDFTADLPEPRLPARLETTCYRITQSAVTNVVRHAQAKHVRVELRLDEKRQVNLTVEDDGIGFDVNTALAQSQRGASMGLVTMRERAALIGGTFEIESAPIRGTRVRASLPLTE